MLYTPEVAFNYSNPVSIPQDIFVPGLEAQKHLRNSANCTVYVLITCYDSPLNETTVMNTATLKLLMDRTLWIGHSRG